MTWGDPHTHDDNGNMIPLEQHRPRFHTPPNERRYNNEKQSVNNTARIGELEAIVKRQQKEIEALTNLVGDIKDALVHPENQHKEIAPDDAALMQEIVKQVAIVAEIDIEIITSTRRYRGYVAHRTAAAICAIAYGLQRAVIAKGLGRERTYCSAIITKMKTGLTSEMNDICEKVHNRLIASGHVSDKPWSSYRKR